MKAKKDFLKYPVDSYKKKVHNIVMLGEGVEIR